MQRSSGILMHISSLPSPYGIGTLGREAYKFVDFLRESGTKIWQVLPIGPTSYGDSPYQSFSTFAGNPYFIDLDMLKEEGILKESDYAHLNPDKDADAVDYEYLYLTRYAVLRAAFKNAYPMLKARVDAFSAQRPWLFDYAFFSALKDRFGGKAWSEWPNEEIRFREPDAMTKYARALSEDIAFHSFVQYLFFGQWAKLKSYANRNGVLIFGDMPIYVAMDSADTWAEPHLFLLDEQRRPLCVAGVPPDYFTEDGQLWGNPIYNWPLHKKTGYEWWVRRMRAMFDYCDIMRVDHFIGFANYYEIPADAPTAKIGTWRNGPGSYFFQVLSREIPSLRIVAEDLGVVTPKVKRLLKVCGYPGMKVLLFGFDSDEKNMHLPANISPNTVLYTGTHDNDTVAGWWQKAGEAEKSFARAYLNMDDDADVCKALISAAYASCADTVVIPMQDHLRLGSEARMNTPGTVGLNWKWRIRPEQLTDTLKDDILSINKAYHRTGDTTE